MANDIQSDGAKVGRVLAIDFGAKRIGLAISDPLGITGQGLPTRERTRMEEDLRHIDTLLEEYGIERVIVGNPIGHAGNETGMSGRAREFAEKLRRRLPCLVELWDERLTTVIANRVLRESGMGVVKRRHAVDRVAATVLLQSYLDYHCNERTRMESFRSGEGETEE